MPASFFATRFRRTLGPGALGLAVLLCLLPFVVLCWYAHPSADDFLTANDVRKHGHWGYLPHMYTQWSGRYTSIALWSLLNPVAYGYTTEGYGLVCLLLILTLPLVLYVLLRALLAQAFSARTLWLSSGGLTALFLLQMPSPAEGFYWITSNYNYLLPAQLSLLALAALARRSTVVTPAARRRWLLLAGALAVISIGGNETNAIAWALGVGGFTVVHTLRQHRLDWAYVGLTVVVALACAAAFFAPGNFARMGPSDQRYPLLEVADRAALSMYRGMLVNWVGNGLLLALTVLLLPVAARLHQAPELPLNRLARYPLLITLLILLSLFLPTCLSWWSTWQALPPRARNVLYLFFLVAWFLHAYAWARYAWRRRPQITLALPRVVQVALVGWLVLVFALGHTRHLRSRDPRDNANNIFIAYQDWLGGAAARYDAELTARYKNLRASGWTHDDVVVEPLREPPRTLLFGDVTPDTNDWTNQAYAEYFGKKTIRVPPSE